MSDPWVVWTTAALLVTVTVWFVYEMFALRRSHDRWPTITQMVRRLVPGWLMIPFLVWLLWHALVTYSS